MVKKITEEELKQLKATIQEGKYVVGTDVVLKKLKSADLAGIYLASNCPENLKKDFFHYAEMAQTPIFELTMNNEELGIFCKKNFFISVLGITK